MMGVCKSIEELREGGYALCSPYALKEKHIRYLVKRWIDAGQSGGTIENKLTYLRAFAGWMGKTKLVGTLGDYADRKAHGLVRSYTATEDKSWQGKSVDMASKIDEIGRLDAHVAVQLKLQATFGLRVEESFMLQPALAVRKPGVVSVVRGTKGGRPREVSLGDGLRVLEEAARLSNEKSGSTIPKGYTLEQWRAYYYSVLRRHGVTRKALGVTSHGLRHQYLQERYEDMTGVKPPIKGGDERPTVEQHQEALKRVVEAAGHSRLTKANAYLSTFSRMEGKVRKVITPEEAVEAVKRAGGSKTVAAAELGVTRQALYRALAWLDGKR